jgi:hypothetical protein
MTTKGSKEREREFKYSAEYGSNGVMGAVANWTFVG